MKIGIIGAGNVGCACAGIGIVSARIAEMVLNDERAAVPIGSFQKRFGVTLSLPSVVGRHGVIEVLEPDLSDDEQRGLETSADVLRRSQSRRQGIMPDLTGCRPTPVAASALGSRGNTATRTAVRRDPPRSV
jgi:malate/lactate dehydrogenase